MKDFLLFNNGNVIDVNEIIGIFAIDEFSYMQLRESGYKIPSESKFAAIMNGGVLPIVFLNESDYKELVVYHLGFRNVLEIKHEES